MFSNGKMFLFAVATAIFAPIAASAVTVPVLIETDLYADQPYGFAVSVEPADEYEFRFNVKENLVITEFSLAATGTGSFPFAAIDVFNLRFGFTNPPTEQFTVITSGLTSAFAGGFLPGGTFAPSTFSIFVADGIQQPVQFGLSFTTSAAPSEVPLPAAGLMLAPVLVAGGIAAMRRRKTAATEV